MLNLVNRKLLYKILNRDKSKVLYLGFLSQFWSLLDWYMRVHIEITMGFS